MEASREPAQDATLELMHILKNIKLNSQSHVPSVLVLVLIIVIPKKGICKGVIMYVHMDLYSLLQLTLATPPEQLLAMSELGQA